MKAKEIKQKLIENNIRQIDLVKKWRIPSCTVSLLVNRKLKSKRLDRRLARAIGVPFEVLRGEDQRSA